MYARNQVAVSTWNRGLIKTVLSVRFRPSRQTSKNRWLESCFSEILSIYKKLIL